MKKNFVFLFSFVSLVCSAANAQFVLPNSKKFSASIVNNLPQCTSPSVSDDLSGAVGCLYTGPVTACQLTDLGQGSFTLQKIGSASKGTQDISLKLYLKGLNASCEGLALYPRLKVRIGGSRCAGGQDCVLTDINMALNGGTGGCIVENGKCMLKTSLNVINPGVFPSDKNSTFQILECGVRDLGAGSDSLTCGSTIE